mmetsp:Transcript_23588/g.50036  ORF Transcript_23588/g.50036 Transcript_23588/m.50036 type:complete len:126 (+) Transcript_23588:488-865(+)
MDVLRPPHLPRVQLTRCIVVLSWSRRKLRAGHPPLTKTDDNKKTSRTVAQGWRRGGDALERCRRMAHSSLRYGVANAATRGRRCADAVHDGADRAMRRRWPRAVEQENGAFDIVVVVLRQSRQHK